MAPKPDVPTLLSTFIADEDAALITGHQGEFWPRNHYLVKPALPKAHQHLEPADRQRLYFHFLRLSGEIPVVPDKELPHLVAGYRKVLPLLDTSQASLARRHKLLFGFGFDDEGALPDGVTADSKQLKEYNKLIAQCSKYTSLPAQRAKIKNFIPYTHHGERLYQTLTHLGYCHERRYGPEIHDTTNLVFWGMVLVILLHEGRRADLLHDLLDGGYPIPQKDNQLARLHSTVQAVLSAVPVTDRRFRDLAERLAAIQRERRAATESMAFARALALPFGADEDWRIDILIPMADHKGNPYSGPNFTCEIKPDPDWQWHIQSRLGTGLLFSEWSGRVTQNDMDIDGLGVGNLLNMPIWLRNTERKLGIRFDVERAVVTCGRNRAAARQIMEWLSRTSMSLSGHADRPGS